MNPRIPLIALTAIALPGPDALSAARAPDLLPHPNADFQAKPRGSGLEGFAVTGNVEPVATGTHQRRALRVHSPVTLAAEVHVPEPPHAESLDPAGWFLFLTLDVLAVESAPRHPAEVTARWIGSGDDEPVFGAVQSFTEPGRFEFALGPADFAKLSEAPDLRLELEFKGAALTIDDLRMQRFHVEPTRKLIGKANGRLGPDRLDCGPLGFVALTEHRHTAFSILQVRRGSPAAKASLGVGDLVLGIGDESTLPASSIAPGHDWFERSHEARLGRAIAAHVANKAETLRLRVLRGGQWPPAQVEVALPADASIDPAFPLSGRLYDDLVRWAVDHQKPNGTWKGSPAVNTALGGLALLGTRDPAHADRIRRVVDHLLEKQPHPSEMTGLAYWYIAFTGMFFCEYHLASGDERVLPWIEEAIEWLPTTTHECKWGCQAFGHGPDGLPYDSKALMAPTAHLLVFEALAETAGVESGIWEHIRPYVELSWSNPEDEKGHGGMGYNGAHKDRGEFWSRSGLCALAEHLRGDKPHMRFKLVALMEERHPWMLNSHAYGEPGGALGLIGLAVVDPARFGRVFPQWAWRFAVAWEPGFGLRYSTPHMGAPYMAEESVLNLSYLALASLRRGGLVMTGAKPERWLR